MRWARVLLVVAATACRSGAHGAPAATAADPVDPVDPPKPAPGPSCPSERQALTEGLELQRHACVTAVRIDPARYRLRLLTARAEGGSRPAPAWARDFQVTGTINASMFAPDQRSIGLLVTGATVNNGGDNPKLGAFLAFDPVASDDPPVVLAGRECPGFDLPALRRRYRSIVQNYRILDCDGRPIAWKDPKRFSAAAVGLGHDGRVVFLHSRAPHQMTELARILAAPELGLRAAMYVEGGPEASLYVASRDTVVSEVGMWESSLGGGASQRFWDIPNVIGFVPR